MEKLYTVEQGAALLTLSPWTLRKKIAKKELPIIRLGRRIALEERALRELLERGRIEGEAAKQ